MGRGGREIYLGGSGGPPPPLQQGKME